MALLLGWSFPYHPWLQHANELPRIFMTMGLVEEGSFSIDTYRGLYGYRKTMDLSRSFCLIPRIAGGLSVRWVDAAGRRHRAGPPGRRPWCRERVFSNKAPGQSLLATPAYAALRWRWAHAGGSANVRALDPRRPARRARAARGARGRPGRAAALARERARRLREAIWWGRITTSTLPAFLFLLLLAWWLRPFVPDVLPRRVSVAAYGLGTLAFTYSVQLMSHQLAAALLFSSFIAVNVVARRRASPAWLLAAGLLGGSALACDYQMVFGAALLVLYALATVRPLSRLSLPILGASLPVGFLLYYHHAAFGSITWTGYEFLLATGDQALHHQGWLGMTRPRFEAFWGSFFAPDNGLFYFSPWLLVALGGFPLLWRLRSVSSREVALTPGDASRPGAGGRGAAGTAKGDGAAKGGGRAAEGDGAVKGDGAAVGDGAAEGDGRAAEGDGAAKGGMRAEALFLLGLVGVYTLFISSLTFWRGGWQTGPRYVAGMLPAFVLPFALLLQRVRSRPLGRAAAVAPALFAICAYALIVTGFPHFPEKFRYPLFDLVRPLLSDGYVAENLGHAWLGLRGYLSLAPYLVVLAGILLYLAGGPALLGMPWAWRRGGRSLAPAASDGPASPAECDAGWRAPAASDGLASSAECDAGWRAVSGVLACALAGGIYVGYAHAASLGMRRAAAKPVQPGARETYGQFLRRAHRDIRRNWTPPALAGSPAVFTRRYRKRPR